MKSPTIRAISEAERKWIADHLEAASRLVRSRLRGDEKSLTLETLDEAFAACIRAGDADTSSGANELINCVGVAFGQSLVDGLGFEWVIATDEYGTDLAVRALPETGDVLLYPTNFVAKRWERQEIFFLKRSYDQTEEHIRSIKQRRQ